MYLLDTNVISEFRKVLIGKADKHLVDWADSVDQHDLFVSVITMHELKLGILLAKRKDADKASVYESWYDQVALVFKDKILPIDIHVIHHSAQLNVPNPRPISDCLIAATALANNLVIVTRNTKHFEGTGVRLINPWELR
jgi:toxin FitB